MVGMTRIERVGLMTNSVSTGRWSSVVAPRVTMARTRATRVARWGS